MYQRLVSEYSLEESNNYRAFINFDKFDSRIWYELDFSRLIKDTLNYDPEILADIIIIDKLTNAPLKDDYCRYSLPYKFSESGPILCINPRDVHYTLSYINQRMKTCPNKQFRDKLKYYTDMYQDCKNKGIYFDYNQPFEDREFNLFEIMTTINRINSSYPRKLYLKESLENGSIIEIPEELYQLKLKDFDEHDKDLKVYN